jgi:hypothetical protein
MTLVTVPVNSATSHEDVMFAVAVYLVVVNAVPIALRVIAPSAQSRTAVVDEEVFPSHEIAAQFGLTPVIVVAALVTPVSVVVPRCTEEARTPALNETKHALNVLAYAAAVLT